MIICCLDTGIFVCDRKGNYLGASRCVGLFDGDVFVGHRGTNCTTVVGQLRVLYCIY